MNTYPKPGHIVCYDEFCTEGLTPIRWQDDLFWELVNRYGGTRRYGFLQRTTDVTGMSGTGRVADIAETVNGKVVILWHDTTTITGSVSVRDSVDDVIACHGHGGATVIEWELPDHG